MDFIRNPFQQQFDRLVDTPQNGFTYDNFQTKEDWPWVYPLYELELPISKSEIESIEIDTSRRMADVNRENNVYPKEYGNIIFRSKK